MPADAGAQQILDLLDAKSIRLTKAFKRVSAGMSQGPDRDGGVPGPIAFAALDDVRTAYSSLATEIDAIETASPSKDAVIAAITSLDQGLSLLEEALQGGVGRSETKLTKRASRQMKRAGNDLRAARAGLAR